jgi:hypothetical protein
MLGISASPAGHAAPSAMGAWRVTLIDAGRRRFIPALVPIRVSSKILARFHGFARYLLNDHSKYMDKPMAFMHLFHHFGGDADEEI